MVTIFGVQIPTDRFDPDRFLATATRVARGSWDDAQLYALEAHALNGNGRADLTLPRAVVRYSFRPPSRSSNTPTANNKAYCHLFVTVTMDSVLVTYGRKGECTQPLIDAPNCSVRRALRRGRGAAIRDDTRATLELTAGDDGVHRWLYVDDAGQRARCLDDC